MIFGYARCSTNETKQNVASQTRKLKTMGAELVFWEYASGSIVHRPELQKMLKLIKPGDTIVCTEITRLTRSVTQLCDIITLAEEKQIKLIIDSLVIDCINRVDPLTEAMILMAGVFASFERKMAIERIKTGIENARLKGVQFGRPRLRPDNLPADVYRYWDRYKSGELTKTEFAKLCSVSRPTIYRYIALLTDY